MADLASSTQVSDAVYDVANEQLGRKKNYVEILSATLKVSGEFQNWSLANPNADIFQKVEECLNLWNDREHGGTATRNDLIDTLKANQRHDNCKKLISKLKLIGSNKSNEEENEARLELDPTELNDLIKDPNEKHQNDKALKITNSRESYVKKCKKCFCIYVVAVISIGIGILVLYFLEREFGLLFPKEKEDQDCCEELQIKGDQSAVFGQYNLINDSQVSDIQYKRIADETTDDTFILAKSPLSGWKFYKGNKPFDSGIIRFGCRDSKCPNSCDEVNLEYYRFVGGKMKWEPFGIETQIICLTDPFNTSTQKGESDGETTYIYIIIVGVVAVLLAISIIFFVVAKKRLKKDNHSNQNSTFEDDDGNHDSAYYVKSPGGELSRIGSSQPSPQGGMIIDNPHYGATDMTKENVGGSNAINDPRTQRTMVKVLEFHITV